MGRLDGKVIVLSAAAQGIGRAAAIVMSFNKNFSLMYLGTDCRGNCLFNNLRCADSKQVCVLIK